MIRYQPSGILEAYDLIVPGPPDRAGCPTLRFQFTTSLVPWTDGSAPAFMPCSGSLTASIVHAGHTARFALSGTVGPDCGAGTGGSFYFQGYVQQVAPGGWWGCSPTLPNLCLGADQSGPGQDCGDGTHEGSMSFQFATARHTCSATDIWTSVPFLLVQVHEQDRQCLLMADSFVPFPGTPILPTQVVRQDCTSVVGGAIHDAGWGSILP